MSYASRYLCHFQSIFAINGYFRKQRRCYATQYAQYRPMSDKCLICANSKSRYRKCDLTSFFFRRFQQPTWTVQLSPQSTCKSTLHQQQRLGQPRLAGHLYSASCPTQPTPDVTDADARAQERRRHPPRPTDLLLRPPGEETRHRRRRARGTHSEPRETIACTDRYEVQIGGSCWWVRW